MMKQRVHFSRKQLQYISMEDCGCEEAKINPFYRDGIYYEMSRMNSIAIPHRRLGQRVPVPMSVSMPEPVMIHAAGTEKKVRRR